MNLKDLRKDSGYTQPELAELAGMTSVAVHRYEQLLYARPSNNYIAALADISGIPMEELRAEYRRCRNEQLEDTQRLFGLLLAENIFSLENTLSLVSEHKHPYVRFREGVCLALDLPTSAIQWCVMTCFHPAQLYKFEASGKSIPAAQRKVLEGSGMRKSDIKALNLKIKRYVECG